MNPVKKESAHDDEAASGEDARAGMEKVLPPELNNALVSAVNSMQVAEPGAGQNASDPPMKERVSFGTNMSIDYDTSDSIN